MQSYFEVYLNYFINNSYFYSQEKNINYFNSHLNIHVIFKIIIFILTTLFFIIFTYILLTFILIFAEIIIKTIVKLFLLLFYLCYYLLLSSFNLICLTMFLITMFYFYNRQQYDCHFYYICTKLIRINDYFCCSCVL